MLKRLPLLLCALLLAACTRPQATGFSEPHPEASTQTVFIATMRTEGQAGQMFGEARSSALSFAKAQISIPPNHETGKIERGTGKVDPARHFAPLSLERLSGPRALNTSLSKLQTAGDEPLLIFVHGYNNTLEDAAFRLAQIQEDFELKNPALLFSWPSAGDPLGYAYDRDSVLFSRSDFTELLGDLQDNGQRRVLILAHSMGGYLVMEGLRQLALAGNHKRLNFIDGVVLMSPDIDPDVFRSQANDIGPLPQPFIVMTSQNDHILNISSLLTGRKERLGRIRGAEEVEGLGVTVLDFSLFENGENMGHMVPVSSPDAISLLKKLTDGLALATGEFSRYVLLGERRRDGRALKQ